VHLREFWKVQRNLSEIFAPLNLPIHLLEKKKNKSYELQNMPNIFSKSGTKRRHLLNSEISKNRKAFFINAKIVCAIIK